MKYTLIYENEHDGSKITSEFRGEVLNDVLEKVEEFIKATGFSYISGTLDFVQEDNETYPSDDEQEFDFGFTDTSVMKHMADDLMRQNEKKEWRHGWENTKTFPEDEYGDIYVGEEVELNFSDYGAAQPIVSFDYEPQDSITISFNDEEKCPSCKLPVSVMSLHRCYDRKCPLNNAE